MFLALAAREISLLRKKTGGSHACIFLIYHDKDVPIDMLCCVSLFLDFFCKR